jgi:hypothetical protein
MPCRKFNGGVLCFTNTYKPGDPRPEGYLEWYEWSRVQHRAGYRQLRCVACGKWNYPQELKGDKCLSCIT